MPNTLYRRWVLLFKIIIAHSLDFINLSESIIDNNLNIENKNNFNLIILTTLKTTILTLN
jgi:hypothetical protein